MSDIDNADASRHDDYASGNSQDALEEKTDFSAHEGDNEISGPESGLRLQPRKRKRRNDVEDARAKRLKGLYRDEYRQLYNSTVTETTSFDLDGNPGRLEPSQIGAAKWTVSEKQRLFGAVGRFGKDDIPRIMSIVRTKSGPEIREFLLLLQNAVVELHTNSEDVSKTTAFHEISAACEISEDCCRRLEEAADALATHQDSWDAKQEQKRHGEYWLLTPGLAKLFDKAIEEGGRDNHLTDDDQGYSTGEPAPDDRSDEEDMEQDIEHAQDALDAVPAAQLLRLSKWLQLSDRVFANAGGLREAENWRSLADPGEQPSIFHTAFSDFHRLAVSTTQRLIAASLTQAISRLHAREETDESQPQRPIVRREDVLTALELLGMPRSAKKFWVEAPRRCGVLVQLDQRIVDYDEAEQLLSDELALHNAVAATHETTSHSDFTTDQIHTEEHSASDTDADEYLDDPDSKQEAYADLFDAQQCYQEEEGLWRLLGRDVPPTVTTELPKRPPLHRKVGDDLIDWRDLIDFKAEWERYGKPIDSARPEDVVLSTSASVNRGFETTQSPSALKRPRSGGRRLDETSSAFLADEEELPEGPALPVTERGDEESEDGSGVEENQNGGTFPNSLPIRRVLEPRRARDAATSSMGEMPPYPEDDDDSSGDDYEGRS